MEELTSYLTRADPSLRFGLRAGLESGIGPGRGTLFFSSEHGPRLRPEVNRPNLHAAATGAALFDRYRAQAVKAAT